MSLRIHHVSGNQECISIPARGSDPNLSLPPFGKNMQALSLTWAVWIDASFPDDYGTQFTIGPDPFTNHNYMQAAIRKGQGNTGAADATWNLGFEGDHPPGVPTTLIARSRWFYQGFRIKRDDSAPFAYNMVADYYYDLPDLTKKIDVTNDTGTAPTWAYDASHSFRIGDNTWPSTAPNEAMEGEFQGFKIWTAFLDTRSLIIEAFNIWPTVPKYFNVLWDVVPLITKFDKRRNSVKRINNRQWIFPNVIPTTGNRRSLQRNNIMSMLPKNADMFSAPSGVYLPPTLTLLGVGR